ncbi:uncharacterized protein LOC133201113 [Saccostrea echinata]|uniref:uncharacterized protein LOC133201113 n=1 Tax=Saccostrea echinata TaxID=191078 RepID=UPI002A7F145B|nr:uncharacterized protein LOC133201113 [Saccostrea echinata]
MANRGRFKNNLITHDFVFDDGLGLTVRAKLVVEIIKYLMYQRQQLPMALDQLKKNINTDTKVQQQTEVKARMDKRTNRRELKNAIKAVCNLDQIFDMISQAFEICSEIRSVLILFGTTPVSPKESYLLTLPVLHPEYDSLSVRNSIKSLFQQIITQDVLGGVKSISPTNMTVMVNAPKNSGITWFLPKPHFKVPVRGRRHVFNLSCEYPHPVNHSIDCGNETAEISGIEPLESSANDISMVNFATRLSLSGDEESLQDSTKSLLEPFDFSQSASATSVTASGSSDLTSNDVTVVLEKNQSNSSIDMVCNKSINTDVIVKDIPTEFAAQTLHTNITEDILSAFVWFQAPIFVKGYKDKSSKSSIFM